MFQVSQTSVQVTMIPKNPMVPTCWVTARASLSGKEARGAVLLCGMGLSLVSNIRQLSGGF